MASAGVWGQRSHQWQAPRGPRRLPRSSLTLVLPWPWHVSDSRGDNGQSWPREQMLMPCLARLLFLSALIKSCYHYFTVLCRRPYKMWYFVIILPWPTFFFFFFYKFQLICEYWVKLNFTIYIYNHKIFFFLHLYLAMSLLLKICTFVACFY